MAAQTHIEKTTHTWCSLTHTLHKQPIRPLLHGSSREGSRGAHGRMGGGGVCEAMLPGYWWAICRLTYRLHSLICLPAHAHTQPQTHTHCHSCSDSVITPVSDRKWGCMSKAQLAAEWHSPLSHMSICLWFSPAHTATMMSFCIFL